MKRLLWIIAARMWWLLPFFGFLACAPIWAAFVDAPSARYVQATLTKLERDERYEPRCLVLCALRGIPDFKAWVGTLTDSVGHKTYVLMETLGNDTTPSVGTRAVWHLWPQEVPVPSRSSTYGTPTEFWLVLRTNDDVRPE